MTENNLNQVDVFTKTQFLMSQKYKNRRDILSALLKDDEKYSISQADEIIDKFMKGSAF